MGRTAFIALLAACYAPSPQAGAPCAANRECPVTCSANDRCENIAPDAACARATCDGDELVGCGERTTCEHGCAVDHCKQLVPSNGITPALLDGATAEVAMIDLDFHTDDGEIASSGSTIFRAAGTGVIDGIGFQIIDGVGVWSAREWTASGAGADDWKATGANAIALYAAATITIAGQLDAGAQGSAGGPNASSGNASTTMGTCRGRAGRANEGTGAAFGEGGGGGGGVHAGGNGGASTLAMPTGVGGTACEVAPTTRPLVGGNAGGHGGQAATNGGGGGGGAVALVAMEQITITGIVGSPGAGGISAPAGAGGGGGGGGGGAILLEAPIVNITGSVTANGGGGGAPAGGNDGVRGSMSSTSVAAGGVYSCAISPTATATRRGGAGGAGAIAPTAGANCTQTDAAAAITASQGAGGGGAAGRIEIRRASGTTAGVTSPAAVVNAAVLE